MHVSFSGTSSKPADDRVLRGSPRLECMTPDCRPRGRANVLKAAP
jgi:hypothetical protein